MLWIQQAERSLVVRGLDCCLDEFLKPVEVVCDYAKGCFGRFVDNVLEVRALCVFKFRELHAFIQKFSWGCLADDSVNDIMRI